MTHLSASFISPVSGQRRSLRIGSAIFCLAVCLIFPHRIIARPPPPGPATMTTAQFLAAASTVAPIVNQVIDGHSFAELATAYNAVPAESFTLNLRDCRILNTATILTTAQSFNLICTDVTFEESVILFGAPKGLKVAFTNVQILGSLNLVLDRHNAGGTDDIFWSTGTIREGVTLTGGGHTGIALLLGVDVGESVLVQNFGPQAFDINLSTMKISGDLVFASNGLPPGNTWDGSGLPPVLQEPSLFGASLGNVRVGGHLVVRGNEMALLDADGRNAAFQPTMSAGRAYFQSSRIARAHLTRVEFKQEVRFQRCEFQDLWLDEAVFEKDVTFLQTTVGVPTEGSFAPAAARFPTSLPFEGPLLPLPPPMRPKLPPSIGGLSAEDTRFEGKLHLDWDDITQPGGFPLSPLTHPTSLVSRRKGSESTWLASRNGPPSMHTWDNFHAAWLASGNADAANEADYRSKLLDSHAGRLSLWVWGYGYRPLRPLLWILAVLLVCAAAFRTQIPRALATASRWRIALDFSLRAAWKWTFGWENTRGWFWCGLALTEQAAVKVMLLLCAKALANTSPLLKEITDKLLPFG